MQNYEQIRAKHAVKFAKAVADGKAVASGKQGGDAIKKAPSMILANGLLAAIAFGLEKRKGRQGPEMQLVRPGHCAIFAAIAEHLASKIIRIIESESLRKAAETDVERKQTNSEVAEKAETLLDQLVNSDSQTLKLATDEALAWLSYARRFVSLADDPKGNSKGSQK